MYQPALPFLTPTPDDKVPELGWISKSLSSSMIFTNANLGGVAVHARRDLHFVDAANDRTPQYFWTAHLPLAVTKAQLPPHAYLRGSSITLLPLKTKDYPHYREVSELSHNDSFQKPMRLKNVKPPKHFSHIRHTTHPCPWPHASTSSVILSYVPSHQLLTSSVRTQACTSDVRLWLPSLRSCRFSSCMNHWRFKHCFSHVQALPLSWLKRCLCSWVWGSWHWAYVAAIIFATNSSWAVHRSQVRYSKFHNDASLLWLWTSKIANILLDL